MEKMKSYLTKQNVVYASLASGILGLVMIIMFLSINGMGGFGSLGLMLNIMRILCFLFYFDFILILLLAGANGYRYLKMQDMSINTKIALGCYAVAALFGLICFINITNIFFALFGGLNSILAISALGDGLSGMSMMLFLMLLAQLGGSGTTCYFYFIKKENSEDESTPNSSVNTDEAITKCKSFLSSEKGKKTMIFSGIGVVAIIVIVIAFNLFQGMQRTAIDLTANCTIEFSGASGKGKGYVDCNPDYDKNNFDLVNFIFTVSYELENDGELKNGDTVLLTAKYSEDTADGSKVKVENATKEIEVSGLEEAYTTYADIPAETTKSLETKSSEVLKEDINESSSSFTSIKLDEATLIGTYYEYDEYDYTGTIHFVYRTKLNEETSYATKVEYKYYDVEYDSVSPKTTDYKAEVNTLYLSGDSKTDKEAIDQLKEYSYNEFEVVSEQLSKDTYKNQRTDK